MSHRRLGFVIVLTRAQSPDKELRNPEPQTPQRNTLLSDVLAFEPDTPTAHERECTHLYFDSYRQGVQLFIQFFEDDQLFQCEAAEPVGGEREERKTHKQTH